MKKLSYKNNSSIYTKLLANSALVIVTSLSISHNAVATDLSFPNLTVYNLIEVDSNTHYITYLGDVSDVPNATEVSKATVSSIGNITGSNLGPSGVQIDSGVTVNGSITGPYIGVGLEGGSKVTGDIGTSSVGESILGTLISGSGTATIVGKLYASDNAFYSDATLSVGGGVVDNFFNITGFKGSLIFTGAMEVLNQGLGSADDPMTAVTIANTSTNMLRMVYSDSLVFSANGTAEIDGGDIGAVTTNTNSTGTLTLTDSNSDTEGTTITTIGASDKFLSAINLSAVDNTLTVSGKVYASLIDFSADTTASVGGGKITSITTTNSNQGTLTVTSSNDFAVTTTVGTNSNELKAINLSNTGKNSFTGNVYASTVTISGTGSNTTFSGNVSGDVSATSASTITFGSTGKTIGGDLSLSHTGSTISLGTGSNTISGSFNLASTSTIVVGVTGTTVGNITVTGAATVPSATTLNITGNSFASLTAGSYKIIAGGSSSSLTAIDDSAIKVNGVSTNKSGGLTFTTSVSGNELDLIVTGSGGGTSGESVVSNSLAQSVYDKIAQISGGATGAAALLQAYIDSSSSDNEKRTALLSATPPVDNSSHIASRSVATMAVAAISERVSSAASATARGISSGDGTKNYGAWGKVFGSALTGYSSSNSSGYNTDTAGLAVGIDKDFEIQNQDVRAGIEFGYAKSFISSNDNLKKNQVDSYQLNAYAGLSHNKYFLNSMLGFAWNEYDASRSIPAATSIATADYSGQTYVANLTAGSKEDLGMGFALIPTAGLLYVHNTVSSYSENGAGTLNLNVQDQENDYLQGKLAAQLLYKYNTHNGLTIMPNAKFSYGYDFVGERQSTVASFNGQTATFTSKGQRINQNVYNLGGGVDLYHMSGVTLSADYVYELNANYHANSGFLNAKYSF